LEGNQLRGKTKRRQSLGELPLAGEGIERGCGRGGGLEAANALMVLSVSMVDALI